MSDSYLAHINEAMFLCYPVDSLTVSSYSHRPVVGVKSSMTDLQKKSHPQHRETHHGCRYTAEEAPSTN